MNVCFRVVSFTVIALLSPILSAAQLPPGAIDAQWLVKTAAQFPKALASQILGLPPKLEPALDISVRLQTRHQL
ncbi:hypothetical protein ACW9IK_15775 [Pseudomonas gingeri]